MAEEITLPAKATLTANGGTWKVVSSSYSYERSMDLTGQSSSEIKRCIIKLTIVADDTSKLNQWAFNTKFLKDGDIQYKDTSDNNVNKVKFETGFIQSFAHHFNTLGADGEASATADLVISCMKVTLDDVTRTFDWKSKA